MGRRRFRDAAALLPTDHDRLEREMTDDSRLRLPVGQRKGDPPRKNVLWRAGLAIHKNPVMAGVFLALIVLAVPAAIIIEQQVHIRRDAGTIAELVEVIQDQRAEAVRVLCVDNGAIVSVLGSLPPSRRTPKMDEALARARRIDCPQLLRDIRATPTPPRP